MAEKLYTIRDYLPEDKNFVLATWLKGLRHGNEWFNAIDQTIYYKVYNQFLNAIVANPSSVIKVACLPDSPDTILGYCVYSGTRLDWVFVKKVFRKIGIMKALIPSDIDTVSHITKSGLELIKKRPGVKFNPFALT